MESKILVSAKSERQKALNIFLENGDLLDRSFPTVGSNTKNDLKISLYLVGLPPVSPILFKFESYIGNNEITWDNGLKHILNLNTFNSNTLYNMYLNQAADIHRIFYVSSLNNVNDYITTILQLLTY